MAHGYRPPGDDWVEGPLFPPDLAHGPIETVRYSIAVAGAEDLEWIWHRPLIGRRTS